MSEHDGTPDDGAQPPGGETPDVGSLGEEAAKLLGALGSWAREQGDEPEGHRDERSTDGSADGGRGGATDGAPAWGASLGALAGSAASFAAEVNAHIATGQAECRWCPVCRTVHAVRQASPEVRTQLRAATTHALQAALAFMSTLPPPDESARRSPDLERIDLEPDPADRPEKPEEPR